MELKGLQVMDLTSLRAVLADLRAELIPSRFEKAIQPQSNTIQLGLRTLKGLKWLEISWFAEAPRIVQISAPASYGSESTLAQQLQHGLQNLALIEIKQKGFERIVELGLALRPGGEVCKTLVLELMGRHSNILLLGQDRKVITIGRKVHSHQSRIRPIGTGDYYVSPPSLQGIEPNSKEPFKTWKERLSLLPKSLKQSLKETYQGISPSLCLQIANDDFETATSMLELPVLNLSEDQWEFLYQRWSIWLEKLEKEEFYLSYEGPTNFRVWEDSNKKKNIPNGISLILGKYYKDYLEEKNLKEISNLLKQRISKLKETNLNALVKQESLLEMTSEAGKIQKSADQILSLPSPKKNEIQKAQGLYNKAKKLKRSIKILTERISYHKRKIKTLQESELYLEDLLINPNENRPERLKLANELFEELDDLINIKRTKKASTERKNMNTPKPLLFKSPRGLLIQVGRNHRQNNLISLQQARKGDIWFHAQECPGSHVVLKASIEIAEEEDIQMAADLAAFFSKAKGNKLVPVIIVPTDHLQRIPGEMPGVLRHRGGEVCWAKPSRVKPHIYP